MNEIETLIESAQERKYTEFDAKAKTLLESKIAERMSELGYFDRLNLAQGITEEEGDTAYQKAFRKLLSKYKVESPDELKDDAEKKKFFDEVEKIKKD